MNTLLIDHMVTSIFTPAIIAMFENLESLYFLRTDTYDVKIFLDDEVMKNLKKLRYLIIDFCHYECTSKDVSKVALFLKKNHQILCFNYKIT